MRAIPTAAALRWWIFGLLPLLAWTACGEPVEAPQAATGSEAILFVRGTDAGATDIFHARIADGSVRPLAETPEAVESRPVWLRSVQRVLYARRPTADPLGSSRLAMLDPLRGDVASLAEKSFLKETDASISADGKRVVYVFEAPPGVVPGRGVRVAAPMTGRDQVLGQVSGASAYLSPRLSPNVDSVAVQVHRGNRGDDLWLLGAGRSGPLVNNPRWHDAAPRFARDGGSVFFSRSLYRPAPTPRERRASRPAGPEGGGDICRVLLSSQEVDCVVESADAREDAFELSPTRDEMVFVRKRDGASDLFLAGLDGENERQITDSPDRAARQPVWSPDGERIAYVDGRAPQVRVVVVDRQGAVLLETPGYQPAWAPSLE